MLTRKRYLALAWLALTLILCVGDHFFHLRTGMLEYNWEPLVDHQSVWIWLVFSIAAALMVGVSTLFPLRDVPDSVPWAHIIDAGVLFVAAYALSGQLGASHPNLLFWSLVVTWLARVACRGRDAGVYLVHGVVLSTAGVLGEGLFSKAGLFDYDLQQVAWSPWWLAGLYLHGSIALLQIMRGLRAMDESS